MGRSRLAKIQLGEEAVAGTAIPATTIWRGTGVLDNQFVNVFPKENVGVLTDTDRSYIPYLLTQVKLDATPATFEQFPYILNGGITAQNGTKDGGGSGYVFTYPFPTTAVLTPNTYTIEAGDDTQAEETEYSLVSDFELAGGVKEAWTMAANWFGRRVTKCTYTAELARPAVEEAIFLKSRVYSGAAAANFNSVSLISSTLKKASFKVTTGWFDDPTADGQLYYTQASFDPDKFRAALDITFVHNASAETEKDAWVAGTTRLVKILCEGSAVSAGTVYSKKSMILQLCGRWEKFNTLEMADGATLVTGTFVVRYNSTLAGAGNIIVVNALSALP